MKHQESRISKHLKKYGYHLEFSYDDMLCSKYLKKYLGVKKYYNFWNHVEEMESLYGEHHSEKIKRDYIGSDTQFLKILLSGQIAISVEILNEIISFLDKIDSNSYLEVLELGGYDGWASDFLEKRYKPRMQLDVLDENILIMNLNPRLNYINSTYKDFRSSKKYDIIFSILGAPYSNVDELITCAKENIKSGGELFLGLRVQPDEYQQCEKKLLDFGFMKSNETVRVSVPLYYSTETLPIFSFKKSSK